MKEIEERLAEYRRKKAAEEFEKKEKDEKEFRELAAANSAEQRDECTLCSRLVSFFSAFILKLSLLVEFFGTYIESSYPYRVWRQFYVKFPRFCMSLVIAIWLGTFYFFIYHEFGSVFFVSSIFLVLFLNLGKRIDDEPSAYSVFNPNCERLLGSLTAEHFEAQILHRNVHN